MKDPKSNAWEPLSFLQNMTFEEWQYIRNSIGLKTGTEENMAYEVGKEKEFIEWLQLKTGKSRTDIIHILVQTINVLTKDQKDESIEKEDNERLPEER